MLITKTELAAARHQLIASRRRTQNLRIDFNVRPISLAWRHLGREPAYKTATANAAYIRRDASPVDRFGSMPARFSDRTDLIAGGLLLPSSAPRWAAEPFRIWQEADDATAATGDPTALSAWHVVAEIPDNISREEWVPLVRLFLQRELVSRGAPVEWAIHYHPGNEDTRSTRPHWHAIVGARHFRHDKRLGRRHPLWLPNWAAQARLGQRWRELCLAPRILRLP